MLESGDQLVAVAGKSLIDCEDPFAEAVNLIKSHATRPLALRFLAARCPGPYTINFTEQSLGIAIEVPEDDSSAYPVVWQIHNNSLDFPRIGDCIIGVAGKALDSPSDKMSEAAQVIRASPRPLRILFRPVASAAPPLPPVSPPGASTSSAPAAESPASLRAEAP